MLRNENMVIRNASVQKDTLNFQRDQLTGGVYEYVIRNK